MLARSRRCLALGPLLLALLAAGCGAPAPARLLPIGPWRTSAGAAHPLVGRVWSTADAAFIDADTLPGRLAEARYVLLGEQHDHPDHHRLQAWLIGALLRAELRAVAFEMLDAEDADGAARARDPAELSANVQWDKSGWPEFALYLPVFQAIFAAEARILPAHPDREIIRRVMTEGLAPWPATRIARLGLDEALTPAQEAELGAEIRAAHCGHANDPMVDAMVVAQRVKDAWMANALGEAGERSPLILVAGNGHVRRDRGVAKYLPHHDPRPALAVGLLPVRDGATRPADYGAEAFDFVVFTPRLTDEDACVRFREQLERMKRGSNKAAAPP